MHGMICRYASAIVSTDGTSHHTRTSSPSIHPTTPHKKNKQKKVNGEVCNTVRALWTEDKAQLTDADYKDFYRFVANAYDDPLYRCVTKIMGRGRGV